MKFEKTEVWGFEHAIRGMRQPLQSHSKSDSFNCFDGDGYCEKCRFYTKDEENFGIDKGCLKGEELDEIGNVFVIGKNDLDLAQKLIKAGSEHRKFMRQIFVSVDITAPLFWWKEFSTYKVGTVANSTSTMHKLASTPITMDCFETGDFNKNICNCAGYEVDRIIEQLEKLRKIYLETKDKRYWKELIRWLPNSWLQKRTITMNYENVLNMIQHRSHHKLTEWSVDFINWAKTLPYADELLFLEKGE